MKKPDDSFDDFCIKHVWFFKADSTDHSEVHSGHRTKRGGALHPPECFHESLAWAAGCAVYDQQFFSHYKTTCWSQSVILDSQPIHTILGQWIPSFSQAEKFATVF